MRKFLFWATIIVTGGFWLGSHQKDAWRPPPLSVSEPLATPSSASDPSAEQALETDPAANPTQAAPTEPQHAATRLLFVRGKRVALRSGPDKGFTIIDRYDIGREVTLLESQTDWSHVRDSLTRRDGWISSNLLSKSKPEETAKRETQVPQEAPPKPKIAIPDISDTTIIQSIITQSISVYPGTCACPYNIDRAGRKCGRRSAYNRGGGYAPVCFPQDVSKEMISAFRSRQ